jgi:hypothetical protein
MAAGLVLVWLALLASAGGAVAASTPDPAPSLEDCQADQAHLGQLPTCTYDGNGKLIDTSYDDSGGIPGDPGMPGWFGGFIVLAIVVGIGGLAIRVFVARRLARKAGIDEDAATAATIFGTGGVTATYLAANAATARSRGQGTPPRPNDGHVIADLSIGGPAGTTSPPGKPAEPTASQRLRTLEQLHADGLITDAELETRRTAILNTI